jgi:hypothetical protein
MKFKPELAVLEGRWFSNKNTCLRDMFDLLSDIHYKNIHGYIYDRFPTTQSFKELLKKLPNESDENIKYIYVAAHGSARGIDTGNGGEISRQVISNALKDSTVDANSKLQGILFGSCNFINQDNLSFITSKHLGNLQWIAGYSKTIDWITSSALDWCFWNELLNQSKNGKNELQAVQSTAEFVFKKMRGLCEDLGFDIYIKNKGKFSSYSFFAPLVHHIPDALNIITISPHNHISFIDELVKNIDAQLKHWNGTWDNEPPSGKFIIYKTNLNVNSVNNSILKPYCWFKQKDKYPAIIIDLFDHQHSVSDMQKRAQHFIISGATIVLSICFDLNIARIITRDQSVIMASLDDQRTHRVNFDGDTCGELSLRIKFSMY